MNGTIKRRIATAADSKLKGSQDGSPTVRSASAQVEVPSQMTHQQAQATPATVAATIFSPVLVTSIFLIFGGCCSNVYALESIVKLSPASGTIVTFLQFLLTALFTFPSQITFKTTSGDSSTSLLPRLRQRTIPIRKWLIYTAFFLTINILNNAVFNYKISIPLHIILRSASPVTSMLVGYVVTGRRYTSRQILAVMLLFAGVVLAALSDARGKFQQQEDNTGSTLENDDLIRGKIQSLKSALADADLVNQFPGFLFLFSALILSAIMGIYTDKIYDEHGRSISVTDENLFYSHTLSLPWFALQRAKLNAEYASLMDNAAVVNPSSLASTVVHNVLIRVPKAYALMPASFHYLLEPSTLAVVSLLLVNALTQIICITGVNRLSTETTSLTVTIVLNIRKLISLLLSIWLFGNRLPVGVAIGAAMVFVGGGLYGLGGAKKKASTGGNMIRDKQKSG